jgi:rSAM/selenodomain-associated transferase 1
MTTRLDAARAVVAVMARRPGASAVKTRLAARLAEEDRTRLYEAFLRDKLAQVSDIPGVALAVGVAPPDTENDMAPYLPAGATVLRQRGADLGERLAALASDLFAQGARAVILIDSDTPTLPPWCIDEAVRALGSGEVDVVLGPAWDGGYYLVGTRTAQPALFGGIAWSTPAVLRQTLAIADTNALRVHLLQSWYDVDTPGDLDTLARQLATLSPWTPGYPRKTAHVLSTLSTLARDPPRNEHWKARSLRPVYANRWVDVTERVVTLPSGYVTLYGVVRTAPCVGVLPFVSPTEVLLVRQFRYVAQRFTWEMPTGGVHAGESIEDGARRELLEEAGLRAIALRPLLAFDTSKSVVDETAHIFTATTVTDGAGRPDDTEEFERRVFAFDEALGMARRGEIVDSMTLLALLAVASER